MSHGTRKLAPTLTSSDGSRHIKHSRLTPWVRDPSRPTPRSRAPARPTLWSRPRLARPFGRVLISPALLGAVSVEGWGYIYLSLSSPTAISNSSDRWGWGYIYTFPFLLNRTSSLLPHFSIPKTKQELCLSLNPLLTSSPQANPLISPSILEEKGSQTRLESSSIDSQTLKST